MIVAPEPSLEHATMSSLSSYVPNAPQLSYANAPSWSGPPIRVGVIGGSGLYKLEGLDVIAELNPMTVNLSRRQIFFAVSMQESDSSYYPCSRGELHLLP